MSQTANRILGLDIGGANLKAATADGVAIHRPFAVWKQPERLAEEIRVLVDSFQSVNGLAVTMTAELCDCFASKREGVNAILDAIEQAAEGRTVRVWQIDSRFASCDEARRAYVKTAASNWSALATFAGSLVPNGPALLIDIGSTTTDIIPLRDGRPIARGRTDLERMAARELVYTGVRRTPLFALLSEVQWNGSRFHPAVEWFATTLDAYLLLGDIGENEADRNTADGRPATRPYAEPRLARMFCADPEMLPKGYCLEWARKAGDAQVRLLREAIGGVTESMTDRPHAVVVAGEGEFLARRVLASWPTIRTISLSEQLGCNLSRAACAFAVAMLAEQARKVENATWYYLRHARRTGSNPASR